MQQRHRVCVHYRLYIHIYNQAHAHTHTYTHTHTPTYLYTHITNTYMHTHTQGTERTCAADNMPQRGRVCAYGRVYIHIHNQAHAHTPTYTHTHTHTYLYTHKTNTYMYTHTRYCTYTRGRQHVAASITPASLIINTHEWLIYTYMHVQQVLRVHARQTTCSSDVDYARFADLTTGFSPAERCH